MFTWTDNDFGKTEGHIIFSRVSYFERYTNKIGNETFRVCIDGMDDAVIIPDSEYERFMEELKAWMEK